MYNYNRKRRLTQKELEEEAERLDVANDCDEADSDMDENDPDFDPNFLRGTDSSSKLEDEIEYVLEEDEDYCPEKVDEDLFEETNHSNREQEQHWEYASSSGMLWSSKPVRSSCGRRPAHNILTEKSGLSTYSVDIAGDVDAINLFITKEMKDIICRFTNQEAMRVYNIYNEQIPDKEKRWKEMSKTELDAFIGVLLSAGALHCRKERTSEMWTTEEPSRRAIFTACMSRDRFIAICTFIRFDDKRTRPERRQTDKLAAIRDICAMLVKNCKNNFIVGEAVTVDEQLVSFSSKVRADSKKQAWGR